LISIGEFKCRC